MKKKLKLCVLITLILGFSKISSCVAFQFESATYVEGNISGDVIWAFEHSPYVVTNDIIVDAGSSLVIEPGVEVRFDGNFSLIVDGSFYAIGDAQNSIIFTSNELEPVAGDWYTIEFNGAVNDSFIMNHSIIEHAMRGLTTKSSAKVAIEKSKFLDVSQRGVYLMGESNALIKDNVIESDIFGIHAEGGVSSGVIVTGNYIVSNMHGIYISGQPPASQIRNVTISGNTILSEMDGIRLNSHYTTILNGARIRLVTILNNTLRCARNGIYLFVESWYDCYIHQVTVSANIILLDRLGDGIHLHAAGMWRRFLYDVVVSDNNVSNATNGIYLHAGEHTYWVEYDAAIFGNRIFNNEKGISILTYMRKGEPGINANITANSICHNTLGISFENLTHNFAQYNNIYRNSHGMALSDISTVNATPNYWGDDTGPYHVTLNPTGKGNTINGSEKNMVFRPFLLAPISDLNELPVAVLRTDKESVTANQPIMFNATASTDDSYIDEYFFDFGDGTNSGWTTISLAEHKYTRPGIYNASLIVRDDLGFTNDNLEVKTITVLPVEGSWFDENLIWILIMVIVVVVSGFLIWRKGSRQA